MEKLKRYFKYLKFGYLFAFILGLSVIVNAWNLGCAVSRQRTSPNTWVTDINTAAERAKDFRTAGTMLALVSGCGLVIELSKLN